MPVHKSAPVATPTSFTLGVKPVSVVGITIKAMILVGCTRSGITILTSSIDTAVVRSQFEILPVITILRTCGSSPVLSGMMVDITDTEHSSSGIVVVVVVGCIVVVVVVAEVVDDVVTAQGYEGYPYQEGVVNPVLPAV